MRSSDLYNPFEESFYATLGPNKDYIEINPSFYFHWKNEIVDLDIEVIDPAGNVHVLSVEDENDVGVLRGGVSEMVSFYLLEKVHYIKMRYVGIRLFEIEIFYGEFVQIVYPEQKNDNPVTGWRIKASSAFVKGKRQLHIPADVVGVVMNPTQTEIVLVGPAGLRVPARIVKNGSRRDTERGIGHGWYEFCKKMKIPVGSIVKFDFFGNPNELYVSLF